MKINLVFADDDDLLDFNEKLLGLIVEFVHWNAKWEKHFGFHNRQKKDKALAEIIVHLKTVFDEKVIASFAQSVPGEITYEIGLGEDFGFSELPND